MTMTKTRVLNAQVSRPAYYWHERGFADGFEGKPKKGLGWLPKAFTLKSEYLKGYSKGEHARKGLERDAANGEFLK